MTVQVSRQNATRAAYLHPFLRKLYKPTKINLFIPSFLISALYFILLILCIINLKLPDSNRRPERDIFFFLLTLILLSEHRLAISCLPVAL